jgi:hypothetical protein
LVVEFQFYYVVVRQDAVGYFNFLMFVKTCFVISNVVYFGERLGSWSAEKSVYCDVAK